MDGHDDGTRYVRQSQQPQQPEQQPEQQRQRRQHQSQEVEETGTEAVELKSVATGDDLAADSDSRRRLLFGHHSSQSHSFSAPPTGFYAAAAVVAATTTFDGSTVRGTQPYSSSLVPATTMTWEAWIKPTESGKSQTLMSVGNFGWAVMLVCNSGESTGLGCCGSHVTGALGFFMGPTPGNVVAGTECASMPSSGAGVPRNVWTHVAVIVKESTNQVEFFFNGTAAGTWSSGTVVIADGGGGRSSTDSPTVHQSQAAQAALTKGRLFTHTKRFRLNLRLDRGKYVLFIGCERQYRRVKA